VEKDMPFYLVVEVLCPPFWHEVFLDLPDRKMLAVIRWLICSSITARPGRTLRTSWPDPVTYITLLIMQGVAASALESGFLLVV